MKDELVIQNKPKSNISEDIRTIRTNLQFTANQKDSKVILVTSSVPGEGKSFISSNLAVAFAQNGERVLAFVKEENKENIPILFISLKNEIRKKISQKNSNRSQEIIEKFVNSRKKNHTDKILKEKNIIKAT